MSEKTGSGVFNDTSILEFQQDSNGESFHVQQKLLVPERKTSITNIKLDEDFVYNVAVMGESRSENTAFI